MKKQSQSEIQQRLAGTFDRNKRIYALWKGGARQVDLAREENRSRQLIHKIIKRAHKQRQGVFKRLLDRFIKFLKNAEFPIEPRA